MGCSQTVRFGAGFALAGLDACIAHDAAESGRRSGVATQPKPNPFRGNRFPERPARSVRKPVGKADRPPDRSAGEVVQIGRATGNSAVCVDLRLARLGSDRCLGLRGSDRHQSGTGQKRSRDDRAMYSKHFSPFSHVGSGQGDDLDDVSSGRPLSVNATKRLASQSVRCAVRRVGRVTRVLDPVRSADAGHFTRRRIRMKQSGFALRYSDPRGSRAGRRHRADQRAGRVHRGEVRTGQWVGVADAAAIVHRLVARGDRRGVGASEEGGLLQALNVDRAVRRETRGAAGTVAFVCAGRSDLSGKL